MTPSQVVMGEGIAPRNCDQFIARLSFATKGDSAQNPIFTSLAVQV